jgi:hypothetical protein
VKFPFRREVYNIDVKRLRVSGRPLRKGHTRDVLEVGEKFDLVEACVPEQFADSRRLAVSNFEREVAAGNERCECGRNEAAVNAEAIVSRKEGQRRLVVAHFDSE